MSFGRKGLGAGQAAANGGLPSGQTSPRGAAQPEISPQLAAFLARERAGKSAEPDQSNASQLSAGYNSQNQSVEPSVAPEHRRSGLAAFGEWPMFIAYVLWWFASPIGAHRHYLGAHVSGLAMMGLWLGSVLLILSGISASQFLALAAGSILGIAAILWFVIDAFLIPGMVRRSEHW